MAMTLWGLPLCVLARATAFRANPNSPELLRFFYLTTKKTQRVYMIFIKNAYHSNGDILEVCPNVKSTLILLFSLALA